MQTAEDVLTDKATYYMEMAADGYGMFYEEDSWIDSFHDVEQRLELESINTTSTSPSPRPVARLPEEHSDLGRIIKPEAAKDTNYVVKCRNTHPINPVDFQTNDGHYNNQSFVEAKIWLGTQEQEINDYLTPVVAFDGGEGRWIVMEEVDLATPLHHTCLGWVQDEFEKMGWDAHDLEIGLKGKSWQVYDYGKFKPIDGEWPISDEEVLNSDLSVEYSKNNSLA